MKSILTSIRPRHSCNILNLIKLWEIRKKFPKDYVGWVYIYCTKDKNNLLHKNCADIWWVEDKDFQKKNKRLGIEQQPIYNGKVVGRFWCDKVEEIITIGMYYHETKTLDKNELPRLSCLTRQELDDYLQGDNGYAIHITNLEIFDKPKEIREFVPYCELCGSTSCCNCKHAQRDSELRFVCCNKVKPLNRAPQSFMFIEV